MLEKRKKEDSKRRGGGRMNYERGDGDNEADQSRLRAQAIRIKLAGPWQRLGQTVGPAR